MSRPCFVTIAGLVVATSVAMLGQQRTSDEPAVDAYRDAIRIAQSGRTPRAIESALDALTAMHDALMRVRNDETVLESLPAGEFDRVQKLPGALINRDEVLIVEPDPDYFVKLAAARGDAADRAFAAALKATHPDSVWPIYLEQQTDATGCTRFGSMTLVRSYRTWTGFQRRFPGRYVARARSHIDDVVDHLTTSTCPCGTQASVERELQQFLRTFPTSPARAIVQQRLQAVQSGRSDVRPNCRSG